MHVRSYMYAVSKTEAPVTKDKRNAGSEEINKQSNPNICGMGQPVTACDISEQENALSALGNSDGIRR